MTNELIILGLLYENAMSGYDIKKICEEKFTHYSDVNTSSIYFSLKKLEKLGFIIGKDVKEGHMIKKVFTITTKGKNKCNDLIKESLSIPAFPKDEFNVGLSFANHINKKELIEILNKRKDSFKKGIIMMENARKTCTNSKLSDNNNMLFERGIMHMKTEIIWLEKMIKNNKNE